MTPEEQMFYGTLPQDTQDFGQVLQGIRRNIGQFGRAAQYLPYDILGGPVDLATLAMRPFGYQTQTPVGGSDWLINLARQMGVADKPTGSGAELAGRMAFGAVSPVAATRGLTQVGRFVDMLRETPPVGSVNFTPQEVQAAQQAAQAITQPKRSDIGFYSKLEEATIPLQNKGTGQQYLAQIEKTAGVKPEEIQWTGLDTFLQGRKSVTKDEVLNYLDQNRVDVQEVRLGDTPFTAQAFNERFSRNGIGYTMEQTPNGPVFYQNGRQIDYSMLPEQMQATLENNVVSNTKFSKYTLPGGENYREILLTLPQKQLTKEEAIKILGAPENAILTDADMYYASQKAGAEFRSSHFDQPNILAHMRVNDRVVDGKKTLFIEEIQSDWHQAGRKKGYGPQTETTVQAYYVGANGDKVPLGYGATQDEAAASLDPKWFNLVDVKFDSQTKKIGEGVPDAPFKTSWHELSLKRAIQEASEKGYEKIAFTTGKTQAERYDLSKQIKTIVYGQPDDSGRRTVRAITPNGDQLLGGKYTMSEIEDNIGKEMAEKIQKSTGEFDQRTGTYAMSGLDLQVGGEGMKGFYDNILPKSLDKLGKKFGAKVGKTEMDGVEVWSMDITPQMRESVVTKGQPLFQFAPAIPVGGLLGQDEE